MGSNEATASYAFGISVDSSFSNIYQSRIPVNSTRVIATLSSFCDTRTRIYGATIFSVKPIIDK